eukprot:scaffold290057_cov33-Tisochrysis_lutea.AAC.1
MECGRSLVYGVTCVSCSSECECGQFECGRAAAAGWGWGALCGSHGPREPSGMEVFACVRECVRVCSARAPPRTHPACA